MTKNVKGLLEALRHAINEAILESNDVAAAMAALNGGGMSPVFSVDVSLREAPRVQPIEPLGRAETLVLSDSDVAFLAVIGITDPSWTSSVCQSDAA
ncbi:MAG TPA: hypothetical protein VK708_19720 [Bryobacteraceae bacterium]|nr:hypothetical protein [Bryobacteraceae bacterium]